jgi:hypothetical protein
MSIVLLESFDWTDNATHLNLRQWITNFGTGGDGGFMGIESGGRTDNCLFIRFAEIVGHSASICQQVSASQEDALITLGFALRPDDFGEGSAMCRLMSDNIQTEHVRLGFTNAGFLYVLAGPGLPQVAISPQPLLLGAWTYIEVQAYLARGADGGRVVIQQNGAAWFDAIDVNTKNGGTKTTFDSILFTGDSNNYAYAIDDLYLTNSQGSKNNGFLGDTKVIPLRPAANGDRSDLINDTGNHINNFSHVNSPVTQTDKWVSSPNTGEEDTYVLDSFDWDGYVYAIQTNALTDKNNSQLRSLEPVIRESGNDYYGTSVNLPANSPIYALQIFEENPSDGSDWTPDAIQEAQFGVRVG